MSYVAYVTRLKNVRKHPNADRLLLGECFGNTVCVNLNYTDNQLGIYFPVDGQLSEEFCQVHDLVRRKDENGNQAGGYMDPGKRNVTAVKLRGEKSDGLFMPITCVEYTGVDIATLKEGDNFTALNGHEICQKYIPRTNHRQGRVTEGNRTRKKRAPIAPLFVEHADTEQLAYNVNAFKVGDQIEITLKMHGTSQRTAHLPTITGWYNENPFWYRVLRTVDPKKPMGRLTKKIYERAMATAVPIYDWGIVSGTRRTVLDSFEGGFYGSNEFREAYHKFFEGKLHKGEEVYYEVVGFTHTGQSIMGQCSNKKLNDKEFVKQYGDTTTFSYGCAPQAIPAVMKAPEMVEVAPAVPQSDIYVYRMTMINEDGNMVEYSPEFMRYRCEQMGVKTVPVFAKGHICMDGSVSWINVITGEDMTTAIGDEVRENDPHSFEFNPGDSVKAVAEQFYDGPDPIVKTHFREGVVVIIVKRPKFAAYKNKNFSFKVLEGIVKADAEAPDMEEADGLEQTDGN